MRTRYKKKLTRFSTVWLCACASYQLDDGDQVKHSPTFRSHVRVFCNCLYLSLCISVLLPDSTLKSSLSVVTKGTAFEGGAAFAPPRKRESSSSHPSVLSPQTPNRENLTRVALLQQELSRMGVGANEVTPLLLLPLGP